MKLEMKDNKIIKDLKERNDKLKMQYDFNNIHLISLENKYANLQIENTKLKQELQTYKDKYINLTPPRSGKTYIANLEQQLQSYKAKEDKLREYIEELEKEKWQNDRTDYMLGMSYVGTKVLQILNDKVVE